MKDTLRVKELFESIKGTTKVKEKQKIIEDNQGDALFMETINFLCNPFITTGLSKGKIGKNLNGITKTTDFSEAMRYIAQHNTGRDEDVAYVLGFIDTQDADVSTFLKDIFTKSYSIGIGASGINKILPNFIPEFNVMLAESYDKNKAKVEGKEFIITFKLDGMRIICVIKDGVVSFFSRQGHEIDGLTELREAFNGYPDGVYDGELLADGKFTTSKELFQETMKRSRTKGEKTGLIMYCFDYVEDVNDFYQGGWDKSCTVRKSRLEAIVNNYANIEYNEDDTTKKKLVRYLKPLYKGSDVNVIEKAMQVAIKAQQEGLMINLADSPYQCKRVKTLLKVKVFSTVDLKVIGYEEGQGEFEGTLGALLVDYKGHTVKVGSGFTQDYRKELWNSIEDMVGKIIEVKYFEETENQNGGLSLRFPVFVRLRDDKTEPSLH